jgi:hypothetical protein
MYVHRETRKITAREIWANGHIGQHECIAVRGSSFDLYECPLVRLMHDRYAVDDRAVRTLRNKCVSRDDS